MPAPEIGLSMLFLLREPFRSLMKRLPQVTTQHVELLDEGLHALNSRRVKALKRVAKSRNLELTVHAPFIDVNLASPSASLRRTVLKRLERSLSHARQLGCRLWIFHPGQGTDVSHSYSGLEWRLNIESIRSLVNAASRQGVTIAIENVPDPFPFLMRNVEDFARFYDEFDENLDLVLDIGHAHINQEIHDFISHFSERIVHVHASDNDGTRDSHLGIGYGTIDWESVAAAIRRAKYDGVVTLESEEHVEESLQKLRSLFG
jgi:sugar phosphate isomerase/epimerase